ncbi:MAG: hypothetical protein GBAus27B_000227 [Mycoplasmataceae bacterium]|nr:MAG: hypothetical protein GBAus27B_000227 [Mycoplasmataceae bacterium]
MLAFKDWLPDLKGALNSFYEEKLKSTIESKNQEYKELLQENFAFGQRTQRIVIALGIAIFLLLAIAYFWQGDSKYLALGALTGYLLPYIYQLIQENNKVKKNETNQKSSNRSA